MKVTRSGRAKLVADWRASGESARDFAARKGIGESTLRVWGCRMGEVTEPFPKAAAKLALARVIRRPSRLSAEGRTVAATTITVAVGAVRVEVSRGFDGALLREVVAALGGAA